MGETREFGRHLQNINERGGHTTRLGKAMSGEKPLKPLPRFSRESEPSDTRTDEQ